MSLRRQIVLIILLGWSLPCFGQTPIVTEQPSAIEQPIAGSTAFGEMIFEEPADWWPGEEASNYWVTGEYWFGWMKGAKLPPLVTTSPAATPTTTAGILGLNSTSVLLSGRVNDDVRPGFRFQGGYWLDHEFGVRIEAGVSHLSSQESQYDFNSDDFPIIGRPYTEIILNTATATDPDDTISSQQAILVAHPDATNGSTGFLRIKAKSGTYQDVNLDFAESIFKSESTNVDAIFGYRFGRFTDKIQFQQRIIPNGIPGAQIDSAEEFSALNIFNGMEFGFRGEVERGDLSLTLLAKMAAGNLKRKVNISGQTIRTTGAGTTTDPGAVYALTPNLGTHKDSTFSIFPEWGATLHWRLRQNVRLHVGYRAMILVDAIRAVDQIDTVINPGFFPPVTNAASRPRRPGTLFKDDDFWIQSLTIGGEWTF